MAENGELVQLADGEGTVYPVVMFMHQSAVKCGRRMETIRRKHQSVIGFDSGKFGVSKLSLHVVPVVIPPKRAGKPMTEHHKETLKVGRKRKQRETIDA
jgi:hypothetical protein